MSLAADGLLTALHDLDDAAGRDHLALRVAEGARVLAAANLLRSVSPRLRRADLDEAEAAQGVGILAAELRRHASQVDAGRGPDDPLRPHLEALRAAWSALVDAADALRGAPADARADALMRAELSWRRARAEVRKQQEGPHP